MTLNNVKKKKDNLGHAMKLCGSEFCVSKNTHVAKCPYSEILLKATCDAGYEKLVLKTAHSTAVNLCTKRE